MLSTPLTSVSSFTPEGRQFAWDSTSLGWLKSCPRKYYYSMVKGYASKRPAPALTFGIFFHSAAERFEKLRGSLGDEAATVEVVRQTLVESWGWNSDDEKRNRWVLIRTVVWFLDYMKENRQIETIKFPDGKLAVELSFKLPFEDYVLCGHIDRIVSFNDELYVNDFKTTTGTIGPYFFERYHMDNQMSFYTVASRIILDREVAGVLISGVQLAVGFSRFALGLTSRSADQCNEWLENFLKFVEQPFIGSPDERDYPMNDKSCDEYGGCAFRDVCRSDRRIRQEFLQTKFSVRHWNPMEPR